MDVQAEIKELKKAVGNLGDQITQLMVMVQDICYHLPPIQENPKRPRKSPEMAAALARISELDKSVLKEFKPLGCENFSGHESPKKHQQYIKKDNLADITSSSTNNNSQTTTQTNRPKRNFHQFPTSLVTVCKSLFESNSLKPLDPPKELSSNLNPNVYCAYHQMPDHHTNNCLRLKHKIQDLIDNETISIPLQEPNIVPNPDQAKTNNKITTQVNHLRNQPGTLSQFSTPLSSIYEELLIAGHIKPLPPTPLPQKLPTYHNPNAFCAFHQMPSHATDECHRLRHKIQDLIDNKTIFPPPARTNTQSNSNPHINSVMFNTEPMGDC